jgi:hypothetical protein
VATGDLKNGTTLAGSVLAQGQLAASAATIYGPVPASTYVRLAKVIFTETSGTARTVTYGVVKAGGTGGADATLQGKAIPLAAAGDLWSILDTELAGMYLGPGDSIAALASAAASVTYTISGVVSS